MNDSPIFVTGINGFLGSYLGDFLLRKGKKVRAMKRLGSRMDLICDYESNIEWVEGDLLDVYGLQEALSGVGQVYHCAAMVSFQKKDTNFLHQVNVEGTANLINAALATGVQKIVHVSSIAALGKAEKKSIISAETQWKDDPNNTQYAISKYQGELEAWRGMAEGLEVNVVLPSVILGAGFWGENTARFFQKIDDGLKFYPRGGTGFVDVRDVALAMFLLMESDVKGQRLLLSAENLDYLDFFQKIATALEGEAPSIKAAPWMAELMWRLGWIKEKLTGLQPMVTKETARMSMKKQRFDGTVAPLVLDGFSYRPIERTIEDAAKSYLKFKKTGIFGRF